MTMKEVTVKQLFTYPLKGGQAVPAQTLELTRMGIPGDREFVIWEDGKLVDQKETPRVASIAARLDAEHGLLHLSHAERGEHSLEIHSDGPTRGAAWILDKFETVDQGDAVADWLSAIIERPVRLVRAGPPWKIDFPIPQMRRVHDTEKQRFFAATPVSLANQASLDDLNTRLAAPVAMDRFRMNVVVEGLDPYEEDHLDTVANDEVELLQVAPAERCIIIHTDQQTGERPKSDLMNVLGVYRRKPEAERFGSGLVFGNYMTVGREGVLHVGDKLRVS